MLSAWVHTTPPGRRALATDSKNGFSKSSWAGPVFMGKKTQFFAYLFECARYIQCIYMENGKVHTDRIWGIHYNCVISPGRNGLQESSSCNSKACENGQATVTEKHCIEDMGWANYIPSPMWRLTRESSYPTATSGKNFFETCKIEAKIQSWWPNADECDSQNWQCLFFPFHL